MPQHNQIDLVEFPAANNEALQQATAFFSDVFGWHYKDWGGGYSDTTDSGTASGVNAADPGKPTMPMVVVYSQDLDDTKQKVVAAGGRITVETYEFPGGRRFHFTDPSGHELAVWSK